MFAKCARIALLGKVRQTTGINHGPYSYTELSRRTSSRAQHTQYTHTQTHTKTGKTFVLFFSYPRNFYNKQIKQKHRKRRQCDVVRVRERERKELKKRTQTRTFILWKRETKSPSFAKYKRMNELKQNRQSKLKERCGNGERKPEEKLQSTNSPIESYVCMMS